jgi:hypothetical protein
MNADSRLVIEVTAEPPDLLKLPEPHSSCKSEEAIRQVKDKGRNFASSACGIGVLTIGGSILHNSEWDRLRCSTLTERPLR